MILTNILIVDLGTSNWKIDNLQDNLNFIRHNMDAHKHKNIYTPIYKNGMTYKIYLNMKFSSKITDIDIIRVEAIITHKRTHVCAHIYCMTRIIY